MAKRLFGAEVANLVLPSVECCSELEEDEEGVYTTRHPYWRSGHYDLLIYALDRRVSQYWAEKKSIAKLNSVSWSSANYGLIEGDPDQDAVQSLPKNFYFEEYLSGVSHSQRIALDIKEPWTNLIKTALACCTPESLAKVYEDDPELSMSFFLMIYTT